MRYVKFMKIILRGAEGSKLCCLIDHVKLFSVLGRPSVFLIYIFSHLFLPRICRATHKLFSGGMLQKTDRVAVTVS